MLGTKRNLYGRSIRVTGQHYPSLQWTWYLFRGLQSHVSMSSQQARRQQHLGGTISQPGLWRQCRFSSFRPRAREGSVSLNVINTRLQGNVPASRDHGNISEYPLTGLLGDKSQGITWWVTGTTWQIPIIPRTPKSCNYDDTTLKCHFMLFSYWLIFIL